MPPATTLQRKRNWRRSETKRLPKRRQKQTKRRWSWNLHKPWPKLLLVPSPHTRQLWLELHTQPTWCSLQSQQASLLQLVCYRWQPLKSNIRQRRQATMKEVSLVLAAGRKRQAWSMPASSSPTTMQSATLNCFLP